MYKRCIMAKENIDDALALLEGSVIDPDIDHIKFLLEKFEEKNSVLKNNKDRLNLTLFKDSLEHVTNRILDAKELEYLFENMLPCSPGKPGLNKEEINQLKGSYKRFLSKRISNPYGTYILTPREHKLSDSTLVYSDKHGLRNSNSDMPLAVLFDGSGKVDIKDVGKVRSLLKWFPVLYGLYDIIPCTLEELDANGNAMNKPQVYCGGISKSLTERISPHVKTIQSTIDKKTKNVDWKSYILS